MLSQEYARSLRKHLMGKSQDGFKEASNLGREAAGLGLEILEVAKIHEQALLPLVSDGHSARIRDGLISRAQTFFMEAITPIERTHLAAKSAQAQLKQLIRTLTKRSEELTQVQKGINEKVLERETLERTRKDKDAHYTKLLEKSRLMQQELQVLAHQVLCSEEMKTGKISRELRDEIAQSVLGIDVRLLMLRQKSTGNLKDLEKDISTAQRLVESSIRKMRRFARRVPTSNEK